jgi:hypothetical protein
MEGNVAVSWTSAPTSAFNFMLSGLVKLLSVNAGYIQQAVHTPAHCNEVGEVISNLGPSNKSPKGPYSTYLRL